MTDRLPDLHLCRPDSVDEAIAAFQSRPNSRFVAGGTDLIVNMRRGIACTDSLIDVAGLSEIANIEFDANGVTIGAGVTLSALANEATISTRYRAVAIAAAAIAAPAHRNVATLGGNLCLETRCIYYNQSEWWRRANSYCLKSRGDTCHVAPQGARCHAAYSGDLAPALMALGAEVEIAGASGRRRLPVEALYVEDGKAHLTLAPGELVTRVHLPPATLATAYEKVRIRGAIDFPLAGVAVGLRLSGGRIETLRIAVTGANSRPFLLVGAQDLAGRTVDEPLLREIDRLVQKQVQPMRTTLVAANYRRLAAAALARRLTARLFEEAGG